MKIMNLCLVSMLTLTSLAQAEDKVMGQILENKKESKISLTCALENTEGKCEKFNLNLSEVDKDGVVSSKKLNKAPMGQDDLKKMKQNISCSNRTNIKKFFEYSGGVIKDRVKDRGTPFKTINLYKEDLDSGWEIASAVMKTPFTLAIDDLGFYLLSPLGEVGVLSYKEGAALVKSIRQKRLVSKIVSGKRTGEVERISNARFKRLVVTLEKALSENACKKD